MDLFSISQTRDLPLAELLRPKSINDFLTDKELLGEGSPIFQLIKKNQLFSVIFWGPPGTGKTTLARIIANNANAEFVELSAINSGVKELRIIIDEAKKRLKFENRKTVIFLDEIHHYNKTQQDSFLHDLENGSIYLIGATTENPSFQIIPALLSRLLLIRLKPLRKEYIFSIIQKGIKLLNDIKINEEAIEFIINYANGDARSALNLLELAFKASNEGEINSILLEKLSQQSRLNYEKGGDGHYDHASAYQKSLRGSDANAALYWLAKMIIAGEDPRFIARRLLVVASEDVGLADPIALLIANATFDAVERLGLPEARIHLAHTTAYIAKAPKSNKAYKALDKAMFDIQNGKNYPVPFHLKDSHYKDASKYGHGINYVYTHDQPDFQQEFLPKELKDIKYLDE